MPYIATVNPQKVSDNDEKGTARLDSPPAHFASAKYSSASRTSAISPCRASTCAKMPNWSSVSRQRIVSCTRTRAVLHRVPIRPHRRFQCANHRVLRPQFPVKRIAILIPSMCAAHVVGHLLSHPPHLLPIAPRRHFSRRQQKLLCLPFPLPLKRNHLHSSLHHKVCGRMRKKNAPDGIPAEKNCRKIPEKSGNPLTKTRKTTMIIYVCFVSK